MNLNKQRLAELIDTEAFVDDTKKFVERKYSKKRKHGKDKRDRREKRKQKRGF